MFVKIWKSVRISFLLLFLLICQTACASVEALEEKPRSLQGRMEIPADGVIAADIFQVLKQENEVVTFTGESSGISYEWTVFGSDVTECRDCNLAISVEQQQEEQIRFTYQSQEAYGFSAVLSIYADVLWDAQGATVYRMNGAERVAECSASITGNEKSILNFVVQNPVGSYVIVPEKPEPETTEDAAAVAQNGEESLQADKESESKKEAVAQEVPRADSYLSQVTQGADEVVTGKETAQGKDKYLTDPVPEGKPTPVEPEDRQVNTNNAYTCTFSIECSTILNNLENLESEKLDEVPSDGVILAAQTVTFYEGESVYDVLQRVCQENGIHMEASWTPIYNSAYVEGIHNLYEFDCGSGSGWMYRVDGWYPNYGCSRYQLKNGEVVEWRYTCDLGKDIGGGYAIGEQ